MWLISHKTQIEIPKFCHFFPIASSRKWLNILRIERYCLWHHNATNWFHSETMRDIGLSKRLHFFNFNIFFVANGIGRLVCYALIVSCNTRHLFIETWIRLKNLLDITYAFCIELATFEVNFCLSDLFSDPKLARVRQERKWNDWFVYWFRLAYKLILIWKPLFWAMTYHTISSLLYLTVANSC